ncbi:SRPBCC family protein [Actinomycetospora lemnae]|uniref:SRPBCC family protein n=1 Tax=Actinomycetospora lemnae TaxID=3019891 RepID=A0ABT5SU51_9PSEU|nr:SRPBCC family protein [Actinomycetospora sp. DW7H6]MDD7966382.1 SRPBCC family protein [Actinomycetospora sp. DW7H6]
MPTIERTVHSPAPVATVQAYLRDVANTEEWDAPTISCEPLDPSAPIAVGKQWRNVSEFRGKRTELVYTLEVDEPGHLRIRGENETVTSQDDITMVADGSGTVVTYRADLTLKGAAKVATPVVSPALGRLGDDAERSLQDVLGRLPV